MYRSSRGNVYYSSSEAILKGLADDGGLFVLDKLEEIDFNNSWLELDYKGVAKKVLSHFLDDFNELEIEEVVSKAYCKDNFPNDICKLKSFDTHSYLELYHGPTLAFKDMALTMLPHLMEVANRKINYAKKLIILTATSGDTGGAALSGFSKASYIETIVLYPKGGVSPFQEKQMLSYINSKAKAFALNCNFDECQKFVKEIFESNTDNNVVLSSANSINIGRLIPQIIYYFYGYLEMVRCHDIMFGESINVCVPTGNFGNLLASYYAKAIGLPIKEFICASNQNNVLTEFINSGIYDSKREFYLTNSPSMDILVSSNLERLIALLSQNQMYVKEKMNELKLYGKYQISDEIFNKMNDIKGYYLNCDDTKKVIKEVYEKHDYLIDPHTAVAKGCFDQFEGNGHKTMIVSTASPLKFSETVCEALDMHYENSIIELCNKCGLELTENIQRILDSKQQRITLNKEEVKEYILSDSFEIKVPATTANLACAFDVAGIGLDIFNTYNFSVSSNFKCINFKEKFNSPDDNLIIESYKYVFNKLGKDYVPIAVMEVNNNIPISRGLGSSASLIVAGVLAATHILNISDDDFIINTLIEIEGHPDNVVPAYLGGFVSSYKTQNGYKYISYPISNDLKFMIAYPDFTVSTEKARGVLPESISYSNVVYNLSRVIHLPNSLANGNLNLLREIMDDKLHEPYRLNLIEDAETIISFAKNEGYAACISGSGSTLLIIGQDYNLLHEIEKLNLRNEWHLLKCNVNYNKTQVLGGNYEK